MPRVLVASLSFFVFAIPALSAGKIDTASTTCKDYETGSHSVMVNIAKAFHDALKGDPLFWFA